MLQFLLIQFYTVYEKYVIHFIMHVLIWNVDKKYTYFPFQITPGQKMTEVTSRNHETFLISPTTVAEGAWKLVKEL